jgi:hypothetical protein
MQVIRRRSAAFKVVLDTQTVQERALSELSLCSMKKAIRTKMLRVDRQLPICMIVKHEKINALDGVDHHK